QYQHDVSQKELTEALNFVVETAVNQVGVNVNTASSSLLEHVAGLTKTTANNIIELRREIGKFTNRKQLKKVARIGRKTYELSIGCLRVVDGEHALDQTAIHPESYEATLKLLTEIGVSRDEVGSEELREKRAHLNITEMTEVLEIGVPALTDIVEALRRPGRDMREIGRASCRGRG